MTPPLHVLLVDDSETDAELTLRELRRGGYAPIFERVDDADAMRAAIERTAWDLIVCDWSMPRFSALEALAVARQLAPEVPCIVVSGTVGEETAIAALQAGSQDFVAKGKLTRLVPAVQRGLRESEARAARKLAEQEVRESEARYRAMFESSPLPMWVFDAETLAFLAVNEAAIRHYGYSRDEFLAMAITDLREVEDARAPNDRLPDPSREDGRTTWRHRRKDHSFIDVEIKAHEFDFDGRRARLVLVNDVTALLRAEQQLRQAQKMEAVGRLAGGVAHDFNNMLSVIMSYAGLVMSDLEQDSPSRDDVGEILKAGQRAADLTKQLLAFSRQQVLQPQVIDVNAVLSSLDKMLQRVLGEDIAMVFRQAERIDKVYADRGQIEQAVMNLVVNARDAMPRGGKLTIETANVLLGDEYASGQFGVTPGGHVMIAVSDNGGGMDRATLEHIFEPFFTTKGIGRGTGLGLSMVHGMVAQSGGNLSVYSEPGQGTTFKIYLPVTTRGEKHDSAPPSPKSIGRGTETILVLEDEEHVRKVTSGILRRCGYRVLEASTAAEAVRLCLDHPGGIDLLLSDVVLPDRSGTDVVRELQATRPGMKVLFMSGYAGEAIVRHGVLGSEFAFIQKPLTMDSLATKVREVLESA